MVSSPDPLNDSPTFHSPPKARRCSSRVRYSLPLEGSSPTKQTFELDVGNRLSPQKLRVTVEAGSDVENTYAQFDGASPSPYHAPLNHRRERTTTTTVPVKGLSDSEDDAQQVARPKRGRGRPRKSVGTPVPAKKTGRASTPSQKGKGRRKSIGDLVDGDDEEDIDFQIGRGVEIGRGKGRSRSRSTKGASRKSTPATKGPNHEDVVSSATGKKGRGRRKTLVPEEVVVLEDTRSGSNGTGHGSPEMSGALEPIDANGPPSAYSTIRSTTTIGGDEPDIVVARFDPGNETPRRIGWSSPRIVEAGPPLSSTRNQNGYPSPSVSPEKSTFSQYGEPLSDRQQNISRGGHNYDEDNYEDEEEDGVGELREFDTILESEGFSMISVDSVPSLREHLSSPPTPQEKESAKKPSNKSLVSIQEAESIAHDDSFSSIPEAVLEAATPACKQQSQNLLSVPNSRANDSFSSIPPEILEAATPARKTQVSKLRSNNSRIEDSFSSIAPEVLEAATPGRTLPNKSSTAKSLHSEAHEDSFLAIPSAVLDAATPAQKHQSSMPKTAGSDTLSIPAPRQSDSPSRLLTPEETPSPGDESGAEVSKSSGKAPDSRPAGQEVEHGMADESSFVHSYMPSSPPSRAPRRYTYTAHLRRQSQLHPNVTQTPSIVFSSPGLPPLIQAQRAQPILAAQTEQNQRPALSPIARAGRVLQDIVVPSSPRNRSQSLGSPFKSPAADRRSSSIARESHPSPLQERLARPLPRLDLNGSLSGRSPRTDKVHRSSHRDDPFSNNARMQRRSPWPEEKQQYSLVLPEERRISDPRLAAIRSEPESVRSDDAMSWQAEEEVSVPEGQSSMNQESRASGQDSTGTMDQRYAAERAAVSKQIASADSDQVITIESDDENAENDQVDDDEDFGLLVETLNSSSPAGPQRQQQAKDIVEKPRRSKIPSPWRKNSKRLVYSDELSHLSSPPVSTKVALARDFAKEATSQPVTVRRIETPQLSDEIDPADLSGWQIPQKSNFKPRARESGSLDLSALLATSPAKKLPVLSRSSQGPSLRQDSSSNGGSSDGSRGEASTRTASFESRPREDRSFAPIPQKAGFSPRSRDSSPVKQQSSLGMFGAAPRSSLFGYNNNQSSSSGSRPLIPSSLSGTNSLNRQPASSLQQTLSECSQDSSILSQTSNSDKENHTQSTSKRTLNWTESLRLNSNHTETLLPPLNTTSPTKSSLRSPLKTPSAGSGSANLSPSKNVQFVTSSPISSPSTICVLSSTTWSRDHWLLLDSILQSWKPENQSSPNGSGSDDSIYGGLDVKGGRRRRNSTRVISKLLGKNVSAQGEKMKLEQWHLEVVDEFRGQVPGWEEKVVAMRVFACIVGERRRAEGLIGKGQEIWG